MLFKSIINSKSKIMRKISILLLAVIFIFLADACSNSSTKNNQTNSADSTKTHTVNTEQTFELDTTKLRSGDAFYQCVMDKEVLSDKPGSCPKCGMDLSEIKKQ